MSETIIISGSRGGGKTATQAHRLSLQLLLAEELLAKIQRSPDKDLLLLREEVRNYFGKYNRAALMRSMKKG